MAIRPRTLLLALLCAAPSACDDRGSAPPPPVPAPAAPASTGLPTSADAAPDLNSALAATPSWALNYEARGAASGPNHRSNLPQGAQRGAVFAELPAGATVLEGGLLACRVEVVAGHPWDSRGLFDRHSDPDVTFRLTVGDVSGITVRAPEDERSIVLSLPGVTLAPQQTVTLRAVDRDVGRDDAMGTVTVTFEGELPIQGVSAAPGNLSVECRGADLAWAEARAQASIGEADQPLTELMSARPELAGELDLPAEVLGSCRRHLFESAALLGWAHPAVGSRLKRLGEIESAWQMHVGELVAAAEATLPAPGVEVRVSTRARARVREVGCDEPRADTLGLGGRGTCYLLVEAAFAGQLTPTVEARLIGVDGAQTVLPAVAWLVGGQRRAPELFAPAGAPVTMLYAIDRASVSVTPPPVLRLTHFGGGAALRLR